MKGILIRHLQFKFKVDAYVRLDIMHAFCFSQGEVSGNQETVQQQGF